MEILSLNASCGYPDVSTGEKKRFTGSPGKRQAGNKSPDLLPGRAMRRDEVIFCYGNQSGYQHQANIRSGRAASTYWMNLCLDCERPVLYLNRSEKIVLFIRICWL